MRSVKRTCSPAAKPAWLPDTLFATQSAIVMTALESISPSWIASTASNAVNALVTLAGVVAWNGRCAK